MDLIDYGYSIRTERILAWKFHKHSPWSKDLKSDPVTQDQDFPTSQMLPCVSNLSQSRVIVKRVGDCV